MSAAKPIQKCARSLRLLVNKKTRHVLDVGGSVDRSVCSCDWV